MEKWLSPVIHLSAAQMYNAFIAVTKTREPGINIRSFSHSEFVFGQFTTLQGNDVIVLNCGDLGPLHKPNVVNLVT